MLTERSVKNTFPIRASLSCIHLFSIFAFPCFCRRKHPSVLPSTSPPSPSRTTSHVARSSPRAPSRQLWSPRDRANRSRLRSRKSRRRKSSILTALAMVRVCGWACKCKWKSSMWFLIHRTSKNNSILVPHLSHATVYKSTTYKRLILLSRGEKT